MLYKGEGLIKQLIRNYLNVETEAYSQTFDDEVISLGTDILGKTAGKVFRYNEKLNMSTIMENESLINCIKNYLHSLWKYQVRHIFDIIELISVLLMLVVVFMTNTDIPNFIFIPFVVVFAFVAFMVTAYNVLNKRECWNREREFKNEQSILVNDMMRVKPIVTKDLSMRIEKFKAVSKKNRENKQELNRKINKASIVNLSFELLFQYGIILFYIWQIRWENITLASITAITANLSLLMTALGHITDMAKSLSSNSEEISILDREAEDLKQIVAVYDAEAKRIENDKPVDTIELEPFTVQYEKKDESDVPFTLTSPEKIVLEQGDIAVFTGTSGSGKSTVMKMLMDQVRLGKSIEIPNTSRFLYFDETLQFGNLPIYDEFFAGCEVHLKKAYDILEHLHLAQELKFTCDTMEAWMRKNLYKNSMSHGQKQRMVLAKLLYHLDDNIDMLLLDEATSGLDEKADEGMDAQAMLEYCIRYANSDRKRIVILSTHQAFDDCRNALRKDGYRFKVFAFGGGEVKQIG
ncbi:MAG: ATP-binding cassette domain-containing protein [Clostridia bacterium]|nr:ATP-binding cassette domain-containing protein [Clostridia bacterium]